MVTKREDAIHSLAKNLQDIFELPLPINVHEIVKKLEGKIIYFPKNEDELSGRIQNTTEENNKHRFIMHVPKDLGEKEERYRIAHLLGHLFLHMHFLIDEDDWKAKKEFIDSIYEQYGYLVLENEADEFARSLLLPNHELYMCTITSRTEKGFVNMDKLEDIFQIPKENIRIHGERLGYFVQSI